MKYLMTRYFSDAGGSAQTLDVLNASIYTRVLEAGELLVRQGEPAPNLYFIAEGLVKMYYITIDGKEYVKSFIAEGQMTGSLAALTGEGESTFSIVCLEPVRVETISADVFVKLVESDPGMVHFAYRFFQMLALKKEMREHDLLCLAPEQRYRRFMAENPNLASRVTQADIARHLGITPVALSRIRGRIKSL